MSARMSDLRINQLENTEPDCWENCGNCNQGPALEDLADELRAERVAYDELLAAATAYRRSIATVKPNLWPEQDALDAILAKGETRCYSTWVSASSF